MAITIHPANTIFLAHPMTEVNDLNAGQDLVPGMLVERTDVTGSSVWTKPATANADVQASFVLEDLGRSISTVVTSGKLARVGIFGAGGLVLGLVNSSQNVTNGAIYQNAGDGTGTLIPVAAGKGRFKALGAVAPQNDTAYSAVRFEILY